MKLNYKIRDPVHGFVCFSEREKQIIDSPPFQRLRNIKQLALTGYVYPGAMHTRFEHSIGVMELAYRMYSSIERNNPSLLKQSLTAIQISSSEIVETLRLAALFHDVGHLPFSHAAEGLLPQGKKHEDVSVAIIESINDFIDKLYYKGATEFVVKLIRGDMPPDLKFLSDILSGQIDADRMDYLLRDSLHCGVIYGHFDYKRLIDSLTIHESRIGDIELAIKRGGVQCLEALILARYYIFTQVCFHRTRRIYDYYLARFLEGLGWDFTNLCDVLKYSDSDVEYQLSQQQDNKWAKRICNRQHHAKIYETSSFADGRMKKMVNLAYDKLKSTHEDYEFIHDLAEGDIHKFFVSGEDEEGMYFHVDTGGTGPKLLTEESRIIGMVHKKFRVIRIYADCDDDQREHFKSEAENYVEGR